MINYLTEGSLLPYHVFYRNLRIELHLANKHNDNYSHSTHSLVVCPGTCLTYHLCNKNNIYPGELTGR